MGVRQWNALRIYKVIHINVINEVRRLCFGGALLPALFFSKVTNKKYYKHPHSDHRLSCVLYYSRAYIIQLNNHTFIISKCSKRWKLYIDSMINFGTSQRSKDLHSLTFSWSWGLILIPKLIKEFRISE